MGLFQVPLGVAYIRTKLCQCKTEISKNYHRDEDDNDLFASISAQEILDQNAKVNNNFPNISKFQVNRQITHGFQTANGKKISISAESQISIQNMLREFRDDFQETDYETELKDIKARISNKSMESKFRTNADAEKDYETGKKDIKDRMEFNFKKMAKSRAQVDETTGFQTGNGKKVLIPEKGKNVCKPC